MQHFNNEDHAGLKLHRGGVTEYICAIALFPFKMGQCKSKTTALDHHGGLETETEQGIKEKKVGSRRKWRKRKGYSLSTSLEADLNRELRGSSLDRRSQRSTDGPILVSYNVSRVDPDTLLPPTSINNEKAGWESAGLSETGKPSDRPPLTFPSPHRRNSCEAVSNFVIPDLTITEENDADDALVSANDDSNDKLSGIDEAQDTSETSYHNEPLEPPEKLDSTLCDIAESEDSTLCDIVAIVTPPSFHSNHHTQGMFKHFEQVFH